MTVRLSVTRRHLSDREARSGGSDGTADGGRNGGQQGTVDTSGRWTVETAEEGRPGPSMLVCLVNVLLDDGGWICELRVSKVRISD